MSHMDRAKEYLRIVSETDQLSPIIGVVRVVATAIVEAQLAQAEQQRIANLIALAAMDPGRWRSLVDQDIAAALGFEKP